MKPNLIPEWLLVETFAIQYNPNCPSKYLVRLVGHGKAGLDSLPYVGAKDSTTRDALGFGKSVEEAGLRAHLARIEQRDAAEEKQPS